MSALTFPSAPRGDLCIACGQPVAQHHDAGGRWIGCTRDAVIGRDQYTVERRLRLARLRRRVVKVRPFAIDLEVES